MTSLKEELELVRIAAAIEKHAHGDVDKLALGMSPNCGRPVSRSCGGQRKLRAEGIDLGEFASMNWIKAAIFAALIVAAIIVAIHWGKLAGAVVLPVTLVALYAVWRWGGKLRRRAGCGFRRIGEWP
jgi:hypothetical protein